MPSHPFPFLPALLVAACLHTARAEVALPAIFGDHMVLQQGKELPVWGTAAPGESVKVSFAGQNKDTKADATGKWKLSLAPVRASNAPAEMVVAGTNRVVFQDVLVGEVWVCSGQSNMVATRSNLISKDAEASSELRFFKTAQTAHAFPQNNLPGKWVVGTPEEGNKLMFSAVGYFFAREIQKARKTPVGMIQSAWGGTSIQPWINFEAYTDKHKGYADRIRGRQESLPQLTEKYQSTTLPAWEKSHAEWQQQAPDANGKKGKEPKKPKPPENEETMPSALYNAMVHPIIPYAIQGVLWYQGESNTQSEKISREYAPLMRLLIRGWRQQWGQGDFPFLWVQLPAFTTDRTWAELRQSQLEALAEPKTGMAVALDLNPTDNLHPPNKMEVGRRLALLARQLAYGENIPAQSPIFQSAKTENGKIRVTFSGTGSGLVLGGPPQEYRPPGYDPESEKVLAGFEVAGSDGVYVEAQGQIEGNTVVVWNPQVTNPQFVRYAWAAHPKANLYNKEGLPASPFRSGEPAK